MAIDQDVLVVGGGIAGLSAAIAAARAGADVRLVSAKRSTLQQASGLVDVLGYAPGREGPVVDPFEAVADLPADHPYRTVGVDGIRAGLDLFDRATGDRYLGEHTDSNALVPTHGGRVKPTARYPASAAPGLASDPRDALLVGFERLTDFDADLAAAHLADAGVPFEVAGVTLEFPADLAADAKVTRYAHLLDHRPELRADLAGSVRDRLDGARRVGFPAVLGDDDPAAVRADLADRIGVEVFEVPMGPPSLPGLRLEDLLFEALDDAGGKVSTGNPVVGYDADGGRVETVAVDHGNRRVPYGADQFVLATGGLVGKGIDSDRESVREPVFDCHVAHPGDRYDWFDREAFGDHPFARFGVDVDDDLRPLDADGDPEFANLRAAGAVLGGYDFPAEKSGAGVSLATGTTAGRRATEAI